MLTLSKISPIYFYKTSGGFHINILQEGLNPTIKTFNSGQGAGAGLQQWTQIENTNSIKSSLLLNVGGGYGGGLSLKCAEDDKPMPFLNALKCTRIRGGSSSDDHQLIPSKEETRNFQITLANDIMHCINSGGNAKLIGGGSSGGGYDFHFFTSQHGITIESHIHMYNSLEFQFLFSFDGDSIDSPSNCAKMAAFPYS